MAVAIVIAATSVALASCGSPARDENVNERQRAYFAELAAEAEQAGASEIQQEALTHAAESGELSIAVVTSLYQPYFDCVAELGGVGEVFGTVEVAPGVVVPDYRVGFAPEIYESGGVELETAVRACEQRHVGFVWQALYMQPVAVEARGSAMMDQLPAIRECVAEIGITLPEDASLDDVLHALAEASAAGVQCYSGFAP